jgi:hypothetical protein
MTMSGPKDPTPKEAQLPDDLDQNPGIGQSEGLFARAGSADAELIAGESTTEGDVENAAPVEESATDDLGRTND